MVVIFPIERWWTNFQWYVLTVGIWLYAVYFLHKPIFYARFCQAMEKSKLYLRADGGGEAVLLKKHQPGEFDDI